MKLEVGMYVRFNWRKQQIPILIGKIIEVDYDETENNCCYLTDLDLVIAEDNVIKASHNIIDLIEVGDYVNGYKVRKISSYEDNEKFLEFVDDCYTELLNREIKSIVTKEQFESMSYKV